MRAKRKRYHLLVMTVGLLVPAVVRAQQTDSIKADSVFQKVGLQNGDVITEVNGIVIDRVEATSAIFDEFATAEAIDIAALRGGASVKLSASAADLLEQR